MKDELQTKLVEILTSIHSATSAAKDFTLAQLPDIAQSYVMYGRAYLTTMVIATAILIFAGVLLAYRADKKASFWDEGDAYVRAAMVLLLPSIFFLCNISNLFLVWFAPKVWLIKELAELVK